jgi:hypothetical protein
MLSNSPASRPGTPEPVPASADGDRVDPRIPFLGQPFEIRASGKACLIRLRDLSCGGASGLCDEPLDVGAFVKIYFDKQHIIEAEVRWVRLMNVGLRFTQPLAPGFVRRLQQAHGTFVTTRSGG